MPTDGTEGDHVRLLVQGSVVYGSDFDEGARPQPVATFTMREVDTDDDDEDED